MQVGDGQVLCAYERSGKRTAYIALDAQLLGPMQPIARTEAIVIKDPGPVRAIPESQRKTKIEFDGSTLLGQVLKYKKRDPRKREDAGVLRQRRQSRKQNSAEGLQGGGNETEYVASLQVKQALGEVPAGAFVRVPIDCVCRFEQ